MASLWFLNFALKCIDHFAWPLLALGYPMCASVQAIETDSNREMRDLISYWILLSLCYLFEHAFMGLLQWFQFWPYMKLMIIFWLIIPDFRRSSYVYSNLIRSYISMKPPTAISWLNNWRKHFVVKEIFLLQAENYIKENGTEALAKLIASKEDKYIQVNGTEALEKLISSKDRTDKLDTEATNAIRANCKKEMQQTNGKMHQTEHKGSKDLKVIQKKEIPASKQDIPSIPNLALSQNASSSMVESKGNEGKDRAGEECTQSSTHKEVQKEWTCASCPVIASSEEDLNSNHHGKKHRAGYEALKAKTQPVPQKLRIDLLKEEWRPKNITNQLSYKTTNGESILNIGLKGNVVVDHEKDTTDKPDAEATNAIGANCNKEMQQANGKMLQTDHKDIKDLEVIEKKEIPAGKQDIIYIPSLTPCQNASSTVVESKGIVGKGIAGEEFLQSSTHKEVQKEWTCALCQVTTSRELDLNYHLHGKKHRAAYEALKAKTQLVPQRVRIDLPKEGWKLKNIANQLSYNTKNGESIVNIGLKGNIVMDQKKGIPSMRNLAPSQNASSTIFETKGIAGKDSTGGEFPQSSTHKEVQKEWTCALCQVTTSREEDLVSHQHGKNHRAAFEALKANTQPVPQKLRIGQPKEEWKPKNITNQLSDKTKNGESIVDIGLKGNVVIDHKVRELQKSQPEPVRMHFSKLRCEVCNVCCCSEFDLACHLNGRKHLANIIGGRGV